MKLLFEASTSNLRKMTPLEVAAKNQIIEILGEQGYSTYAKLLSKLDVKLINEAHEDDTIAYLDTKTATIYLNRKLNIKQISTIVRHEILHEYLTHMIRAEKFRKEKSEYKDIPHDLVNIAADYEISNRGYTDADKATARSIVLKDQVLKGLVTEDDHPDWIDKSFEEMLELLAKEDKSKINQMKQTIDLNLPSPEELSEILDKIDQQAQSAQQQSENSDASNQEKDQNSNQAQQIASAAQQTAEQNEKSEERSKSKPFLSPSEQETQEEIAERAKQLQKALHELRQKIFDETDEKKAEEDAAKAARDLDKYRNLPSVKFAESLNNFIKRQIGRVKGKSWSKINKNTIYNGTINKGISRSANNLVPVINVYFDRSGSFSSYPEKTRKAEQAIATLNNYARRGQIKINLFYVCDKVYTDRAEAEKKGWGADGDEIIKHINQTNPDNVIIITDSDASPNSNYTAAIPGAAWFLYYENRPVGLDNQIKAAQLNRTFDMEI